jgi:hypothetical protein
MAAGRSFKAAEHHQKNQYKTRHKTPFFFAISQIFQTAFVDTHTKKNRRGDKKAQAL